MAEIVHLYSQYSWAWVDDHGMEVHGNGRCTSPLEALTTVCSVSNTELTDELKERFGVNDSVSSLKEEVKHIQADIKLLKDSTINILDMTSKTNKAVQDATAPPVVDAKVDVVSKGGRPKGSRNKKK
tara:strand:- start:6323 stop:6703 length:381 start_codon:yes stop_codon:yes gene_type:complete